MFLTKTDFDVRINERSSYFTKLAKATTACKLASTLLLKKYGGIQIELPMGDEGEMRLLKKSFCVTLHPEFMKEAKIVYSKGKNYRYFEQKIKTSSGTVTFVSSYANVIDLQYDHDKTGKKSDSKFVLTHHPKQQVVFTECQADIFKEMILCDIKTQTKWSNVEASALFGPSSDKFINANPLVKDWLLSLQNSMMFL